MGILDPEHLSQIENKMPNHFCRLNILEKGRPSLHLKASVPVSREGLLVSSDGAFIECCVYHK